MALASFQSAKSVTALSKSPLFHHQYSSITAAISNLAKDEREFQRVRKLFRQFWLEYFPITSVNHFQLDVVNIFRPHSECLKDLQYRYKANNRIAGNKPLGVGYPLSSVNIADFQSSWSVPLELRRVKSVEDAIEVGAEQLRALCKLKEFAKGLNINTCDSQYGVAKYIGQVCDIKNLVNVIRLQHGRKVSEAVYEKTGGQPRVYGDEYYLIEETRVKSFKKKDKVYQVEQISIYDKEPDQVSEVERRTKKGKELKITLSRWNGMRIRSKGGHSMKKVEFDVVGIRVLEKATGKRVFKRDVFVTIVGEERRHVGLGEAAEEFYHRFDLEGTNRFMKQNLFLEGYQTPAVRHQDNWNLLVQMAMWLLWAASEEVEQVCEKWQQYSEPKREKGERKTASQTRKGLEGLISTFEKERFQPKKCKKGVGRRKGEKQEKRQRYKVVKKTQSKENQKKKAEQKE